MPLHPQAVSLLELMAQIGDPPIEQCTPGGARAARAARRRPVTATIHHTRDLDAAGVPARLYRPRDADGLGLLVFLHGGGWVIGDLDGHDQVCRLLANGSGHAVLSVDYRLAPEHPFPAGLEDALTATRWAHANAAALGCRPDRLAIGGDSAGGNLAAVVAQLAPVPLVYQLLVYPVTDCTRSQPSYTENATGLFLTAELDPLRDEGDAYAARLAALGVPTSHVRFGGMIHGFFSLADFLDDGRDANALAAAALGAALSR